MHRLAARWFGENNSIPEALNHALRASDYPAACDLLEVAAYRLFDQGDIGTLLNWLKALPEEEIRSRPVLLSHCAWSLALNGRYDEAEQRLRQSGEAIESLPNDPSPRTEGLPLQRRIRCSLQALRSHLARARGDPESTIKHARLAEADLDENDVRIKGVLAINLASAHWMKLDLPAAASTFAEAARHSQEAGHAHVTIMAIGLQAKALMILGRLSEARRVCDRAVEIASSQGMERIPGAGYAYVVLGDLLYERNELNEALERISLGMELYRQSGATYGLGDAYAAYARVLHALSDHDAVAEVLDEIEAVSEQGQFVPGECLIWPVLAKISLAEGDQRRAQGWLEQMASLSGADVRQVDQLLQARFLLARGTPEAAHDLLTPLLALDESSVSEAIAIETIALEAMATHALGDEEGARSVLNRALARGEREGRVRTFADEGEPMRQLLEGVRVNLLSNPTASQPDFSARYIDSLLEAFSAPQQSPQSPPAGRSDAVSEREAEVLHLMDEGLSNQEIADRFVVALSTVKWHVNNLYAKLGVRSRTQALSRARALNLL